MMTWFIIPTIAQNPSDLMRNCDQWKITYPTGEEDKTLCDEPSNEYYYLNSTGDAIVFNVPISSDNGSTENSDNIRSELRERTPDGSADIYWTTEGTHMLYVKQAITHLPINTSKLVATQIHGNKDDDIDDSMVLRLEDSHLFLTFNGGDLRSNVTVKTDYALGTIHEVIFLVVDDKHYCYYAEDGNLLSAYQSGNASSYLVKDGSKDYVMDLKYDETYFKVGNYTQSNPEKEGDDTDDPDNYGEVLVYDFMVQHGDITFEDIAVTGMSFSSSTIDLSLGSIQQLSTAVTPSNALDKSVSYSSNNTSVATVSSSGVVTAIAEGSATIAGTTDDGGFTDTIVVTVLAPSTGDNLALNKSITGTGSVNGTNVVANLVDGLTSTRWAVEGYPQTATIDLGAVFILGSTELVCYSDRAYQYTVSVSTTENGTYTEIVDRSANTTPGSEISPIIDNFSDVDARYVKITVTGANLYSEESWVSLLEFRVFAGEGVFENVPVTGLSITPAITSLTAGETEQLSFSVAPSNATNQSISYSSSNTSVATVSSAGVVTAVAAGSATITGTTNDGGFTDTIAVTVTAPFIGTNLALNKSITGTGSVDGTNVVANLVDGFTSTRWAVEGYPQTATIDLGAVYTLGSTEVICYSDRAYQYTVSVSSTENGTYTEIVDRSANTTPGSEASPIFDDFSDVDARYVKITVTGADVYSEESWVSLLEFRVLSGEVIPQDILVTGLSITPSSASLTVGETEQLSSAVTPSDATDQGVSYSSSDALVATVSSKGLVTAIAAGSATIIAITDDGGFTDTTVITVTDPSIVVNLALNKTVSGTGTEQTGNVVANLVDGLTTTRWAVEGYPQTAIIDLGAIYPLGSTEVVCFLDRAYQFTVSVSSTEDGTYTDVVDRSGNTTSGSEISPITDSFADIDARYVRVTVTGADSYSGTWVSLFEVRVFEGNGNSQGIPVTGLSITSSSTSLTVGETEQLSSAVTPSDATDQGVSYSSSDALVATVSSTGVVTAIAAGSTTITGTTDDGGFTDTTVITVTDPSIVVNLALNKTVSGTGIEQTGNVVANLVDGLTATRWAVEGYPQTATIDLGAIYTLGSTEVVCFLDRAYQYTVSVSSTEDGAYTDVVDRSGNTTPGSEISPIIDSFSSVDARYVKITVTGADSYTGTWVSLYEVRVFAGEGTSQDIPVTGLSMTPSNVVLSTGGTQQLSSSVAPIDATNQTVSYSSSNTSVATVSSTGVVIAMAEGGAIITGITDDGGFTDVAVVTVTDISIDVNLALNKSVSSTSTLEESNVVANLVDGFISTRWAVEGYPQTATVDLGAVYTLGRTEVVCFLDRDYQYTISVSSTENGVYTDVVDRSGNTTGGSEISPITDSFADIDARYVKITVTGANSYVEESWVSLLEFRVFAGDGDVELVSATGLSITPSDISLTIGETQQFFFTVTPSNATNQGVSYSSSDALVATVSSSGLVTAIAAGSATIIGTTNDGSFIGSSNVIVTSSGVYAAPYYIPKIQDYLAQCKLQSPTSDVEATNSEIISGYSSNTFYVADGDKVAFYQTGSSTRTELRFIENWYVSNTNETLHTNVKIVEQTCEQFTFIQIHDDANVGVGNGPNKPLLRVYKSTTKSPINHIWAAIKTSSDGITTEHIDLGLAPSGYFDCDVSIASGNMIITIDGSEKVNQDVSYWTYPSYWKNGVYLQDSGEAITYFNELTLSNSSSRLALTQSNSTKAEGAANLEETVISLWPNPATNIVNISGIEESSTIAVYNQVGKLVLNRSIQNSSIDISELTPGLYNLMFSSNRKIINRRIIKK